jgi:hypothetical protein
MDRDSRARRISEPAKGEAPPVPSWVVGLCGVAAVASLLFSILLFLNR